MSFLIDTDICSSYLGGNRLLYGKFQQYAGRISLSTVVVGELLTWSFRRGAPPNRSAAIQQLLQHVAVLPVDSQVAEEYGRVQAHLLDNGKPKADPTYSLLRQHSFMT